MKDPMVQEIAQRLKEYFTDKEQVLLAFVFGSAVIGRLTNESDVDIAVLFRNIPEVSYVLETKDAVSEAIGREVDIVVLNDSSPVIRMQVLRNGKLIKSHDSAVYNDFIVRTVKEYDDLKHVRKEAEETILRGRMYA